MGNCGSTQADASKAVSPNSSPPLPGRGQKTDEPVKVSEKQPPTPVDQDENRQDPRSPVTGDMEVVSQVTVEPADPEPTPHPDPGPQEKLFEGSVSGFMDEFDFGDVLGSGSFSTVKQAVSRTDGKTVAVKCIVRRNLPPDEIEALKDEVSILKQVSPEGG